MASLDEKQYGSAEKFDTEAGPTLVMTVTELNEAANHNLQKEQEETVWESIKRCKTGLFWCFMVSMCVIMEGYDGSLLSQFYADPEFAKK